MEPTPEANPSAAAEPGAEEPETATAPVEATPETAEAVEAVEPVGPVETSEPGEAQPERGEAWEGWWRVDKPTVAQEDEEPVSAVEQPAENVAEPEPVAAFAGEEPIAEEAPVAAATAREEEPSPVELAALARAALEAPSSEILGAEAMPTEAPVVGVMETVAEGNHGNGQGHPSGDELLAAADAAEVSGDAKTLRSLLLWAARAYAREGRFEVALDAAHRLLKAAPSDVDTHLVLVELYMARDWNALAAEKLALLERLAVLSGDEDTRKRVCTMASRAFPKDERLGALCS
jgi:hypothetical protein